MIKQSRWFKTLNNGQIRIPHFSLCLSLPLCIILKLFIKSLFIILFSDEECTISNTSSSSIKKDSERSLGSTDKGIINYNNNDENNKTIYCQPNKVSSTSILYC